ncbi:MAG: cupin domain-containing protein [Candidatus Eremiobacterota bacterium]
MQTATMERTEKGRVATSEGWFVVNARDCEWIHHDKFGAACNFEGRTKFPELGINVRVLMPGQPNALYHREEQQEDFLVISGECLAIVEEQEISMKAWDFLHCPPGTRHVFVGAGEGPCVVVMVGRRGGGVRGLHYPVSEVAARHGASTSQETDAPQVAYGPYGMPGTVSGATMPLT